MPLQEEELRKSSDPKYQHLNDDLHVEITAFALAESRHLNRESSTCAPIKNEAEGRVEYLAFAQFFAFYTLSNPSRSACSISRLLEST